MLPFPFPVLSWAASIILLATSPSNNNHKPCTYFRVCQSPACKDDGSQSTLDKFTALAPPSVTVVKGGCVSLCGSGPILEICEDDSDDVRVGGKGGAGVLNPVSSIKRKKVKGDTLISILNEFKNQESTDGSGPVLTDFQWDRLIEGYDFSLQANEAYEAKNYEKAIELYEEAIENGRKPALLLQEARDKTNPGTTTSTEPNNGYPPGLQWLVQSFKHSCQSRLALNDIDGARRDAFAATVFSQNTDAEAHECLAEVCKSSGDNLGEWQAVKAAMENWGKLEEEYSKPMPGVDAVGRAEAAKRKSGAAGRKRELGFRLAKLERSLRGS